MKTIRIYLSVAAIVFSVGGAIASEVLVNSYTVAYRWIDLTGTANDECEQISVTCQETGATTCTVTGIASVLRKDPTVNTSCGIELRKN